MRAELGSDEFPRHESVELKLDFISSFGTELPSSDSSGGAASYESVGQRDLLRTE